MTSATAHLAPEEDLRIVRQVITPYVRSAVLALGQTAELTRGSYRTRILVARLQDGSDVRLFLKEFNSDRYGKYGIQERWRREVEVYSQLLPDGRLGVPRYYGSFAEPAGRMWLVLEFVEAEPLNETAPVQWEAAARWLARMHAYEAARTDRLLAVAPSLQRHDGAFLWNMARRALQKLGRFDVSLAARLDRVLDRFDACIGTLTQNEPTLVHGCFKAKDILFDISHSRVCPVDWEHAALGCRFFDLAHLADLLPEAERAVLLRRYIEAADACGQPVTSTDAAKRCFDCCLLHKALCRLRKWKSQRDVTPNYLLERAERLMERCVGG